MIGGMHRLQRWKYCSGYTIVEFMVGSAVASILVLTAGSILIYGYQVYARSTLAVDLQREATHSMEMLIGKVRPGSAGTLALAPSEVQVTGTDGVTVAIYASNQDLVYDPDTSTGGDEIILVNGTLVAFDVTPQFGHLQVHLELQGPSESMEINSRISLRN